MITGRERQRPARVLRTWPLLALALALAVAILGCRPQVAAPPAVGTLSAAELVSIELAGVTRPVLAEAVAGRASLDTVLAPGSLFFAFGWQADAAGEALSSLTAAVSFRPRSGGSRPLARQMIPPAGAEAEGWLELVVPVPAELVGQRGSIVIDVDGAARGWSLFTAAPTRVAERGSTPNLILLSIDTLRADKLGCYGNPRDASPAIDALAANGALFENVFAQSNWTLPSHYTMMTSLAPSAHGVNPDRWAFAGQRGANKNNKSFRIRGSGVEQTLAERLAARGYLTAAITEAGWVSARFGFGQGFSGYLGHEDDNLRQATQRMTLEWLEAHRQLPFFLFVHTYQTHQPYHQPPPWDTMFIDRDHVGLALPGERVPMAVLDRLRRRSFPPTAADVEALRGLYDGEVRYVDSFVAELVEAIGRHGLERETIVLLTSDHGEELFERGGFDHGPTLYDEVMRVPLILWGPGRIPAGLRVDSPAAVLDVLPTLLELAGGAAEEPVPAPVQGHSLVPLLADGAGWPGRTVFAEGWGDESVPFACAWEENQKLILSGAELDAAELYDLAADPQERRNLAGQRPAEVARLRGKILAWLEENRRIQERIGVGEATLDPETERRLRALGYL